MAGIYSEDLKRRVREANNIVDIVQAAVGKLTRAGRNFKACCPFHNEKTPSFNVNPDGQYFKCFGCGKGGDVFSFVMEQERCEFPEAMRILAERAGITIEIDPVSAAKHKKEVDWNYYLYKLNEEARRFFREQLFTPAGAKAREYIKKRGLSDEICERFSIGYSPAGGSPLLGVLKSRKAPVQAILKAGLASERDGGGVCDFFYDRLMFPITDIQGRVIAFGGRILGDGEPKYLNTRETPLFSKAKTVYAIDRAKTEIINTRKAILVEGYTDVMMCHQFGITNVVACLGTSITVDHVRQLRRVADELLVLTDSDAAGAKASERGLGVLFQEEVVARVVRPAGGDKDPCDFLLAHGKEEFLKVLAKPTELFDYKLEMTLKKHDIKSPVGLKRAVDDLMELVATIPSTLLKNQCRYQILERLNISERDLQYDLPASRPISVVESVEAGVDPVPKPESKLAAAERELLKFLFQEPAWIADVIAHVDLANLSGAPERQIGQAILMALGDGTLPPDPDALADSSPQSLVCREVMRRLEVNEQCAGGGESALCIALAEVERGGVKLVAKERYEILLTELNRLKQQQLTQETKRRYVQAKLSGDAVGQNEAYQQELELRKPIADKWRIYKEEKERKKAQGL